MRFTPTGVGTILMAISQGDCTTVHPHGRGDNEAAVQRQTVGYGSPPRAWGQSAEWFRQRYVVRFTPTGVGTIHAPFAQSRCDAVHPHGRGDNHGDAV